MKERVKASVLASFAADTLALGVHWIYNTNVIDRKYGRVESLLKPELAKYHAGREKGDFTHYGDQTRVLLDTIKEASRFDLDAYSLNWQTLFKDYDGYLDHATKDTLQNIAKGKSPHEAGSSSDDLSGASRIAPLLLCRYDNREKLVGDACAQTAMTHNNPLVVAAAGFFAGVLHQVVHGSTPEDAIKDSLQHSNPDSRFVDAVKKGLESKDIETRKAILDFGQMCSFEGALPSTIHLIVKYQNDLKSALVENIMAGGDSAARGLIAGMILGAHNGIEAIPVSWLSEMNQFNAIEEIIDKILPKGSNRFFQ